MLSKKNNRQKGRAGEKLGLKYLKAKSYSILDENFKCKLGEIDIIALHRDTVVFVEVKARSNSEYGYPREAVDYYKQKKISKAALYYLQKNDLFHKNVRFDVIEIIFADHDRDVQINHIVNAFEITV